ncbi:hypothetical protein GCM10028807_09740 [Spirosoma daeguense]
MDLLEKDLEDMVYNASKSESGRAFLAERGLDIYGTLFRQVGLGSYGIADLVTISYNPNKLPNGARECRIDIYELKKGVVTIDALGQALRYKEAIEHFLSESPLKFIFYYGIHLIGDSIDWSRDFLPMAKAAAKADEIASVASIYVYTYQFDYDGLRFSQSSVNDYEKRDHGSLAKSLTTRKAFIAFARQSLTFP